MTFINITIIVMIIIIIFIINYNDIMINSIIMGLELSVESVIGKWSTNFPRLKADAKIVSKETQSPSGILQRKGRDSKLQSKSVQMHQKTSDVKQIQGKVCRLTRRSAFSRGIPER